MTTVALGGMFFGLIYGLLGIGLVVAYRGSRVINFAFPETGMLAAFVFNDLRFGTNRLAAATTDHGIVLPLFAALAAGALLGALTEFLVVRPLRGAPLVRTSVGTVALGALFLAIAIKRWGVDPRFIQPLIHGNGVTLSGLKIQPSQLLILPIAAAFLGGVGGLYRYTSFGLRLRAVAIDPYAAAISGVDIDRVSLATWSLAGAIAAMSAVLIAPLVAFNVFFMTSLAIRGFAAALVGGLTSLGGAFTAGVLIGVVEAVAGYEMPITGLTDALVAGFVLLLLLVRPTGLVRSRY
jgi:branched-chain amino acid transport system permease protein